MSDCSAVVHMSYCLGTAHTSSELQSGTWHEQNLLSLVPGDLASLYLAP